MDFYVSQIIHLPFARRIENFLPCRGDILPIEGDFKILFYLLEYRFGGSGSNFAIPDLRPFDTDRGAEGEPIRREWKADEIVPHICFSGLFPPPAR
jgi:microcystin-dependent protein